MSDSDAAYPGRLSADYDEAERVTHDLPDQLARVRRQAQVLRERLFATRIVDPHDHLTSRERAAASDD